MDMLLWSLNHIVASCDHKLQRAIEHVRFSQPQLPFRNWGGPVAPQFSQIDRLADHTQWPYLQYLCTLRTILGTQFIVKAHNEFTGKLFNDRASKRTMEAFYKIMFVKTINT